MNNKDSSQPVRVDNDVYDDLVRLSEMTRKPISEIASTALRYAFENSTLTETKVYNLSFGTNMR